MDSGLLYHVRDGGSAVPCYGQQDCCTVLWTAGLLYCVTDSRPSRQQNELNNSNSKELTAEAGVEVKQQTETKY
jgi:hypothetical protein